MVRSKCCTVEDLVRDYKNKKINIDVRYQRQFVWKPRQKQLLIKSIVEEFPIGAFVVGGSKSSLLDGQQRLRTINEFIENEFKTSDGRIYDELTPRQRLKFKAYDVPILYLNERTDDDTMALMYVRLQSGEQLRTAEKVYAFVGNFRKAFMEIFDIYNASFFTYIQNNRYQAVLLAARFLMLELKSDYHNNIFPDMTYKDFYEISEKYENKKFPQYVINRCAKNLKFLINSLGYLIHASSERDLLSFYMLCSYLRKTTGSMADKQLKIKNFASDFLFYLESFTMYDETPPEGITPQMFQDLMKYKIASKVLTSSSSSRDKFMIIQKYYEKTYSKPKFIDPVRKFNKTQKKKMFILQHGLCNECTDPLIKLESAHHKLPHSRGGKTVVSNGVLLHDSCHMKLEREKQKLEKSKAPKIMKKPSKQKSKALKIMR